MRANYEERFGEATQIQRKILRGDERICSSRFAVAWKALFPFKPAEELASRVGCTIRTAAYELSGEHHPSAQAIQALINEIVPPWRRQ